MKTQIIYLQVDGFTLPRSSKQEFAPTSQHFSKSLADDALADNSGLAN
jgi:hypothetical protein